MPWPLPLLAAAVAMAGCGSTDAPGLAVAELEARTLPSLPLLEVSGLAVSGAPGAPVLYAVGDKERVLLRLVWSDPPQSALATRLDLPVPRARGGSQLEAVAITPDGRALALDETRGMVHVLDLAGAAPRLQHTLTLHVPADHPLGARWAADPNRRGEGLARLPGGHLLVAKQRDPLVLIEFGPLGAAPRGVTAEGLAAPGPLPATLPDELFPLAAWHADATVRAHLDSLNDLSVAPGGALYAVASLPRATLARVALPLDPAASRFTLDAAWPLATPLEGKAEGLAFLPDGRALIGFDAPKDAPNLAIVPAPPD